MKCIFFLFFIEKKIFLHLHRLYNITILNYIEKKKNTKWDMPVQVCAKFKSTLLKYIKENLRVSSSKIKQNCSPFLLDRFFFILLILTMIVNKLCDFYCSYLGFVEYWVDGA